MAKVLLKIFILFQLSLDLYNCFIDQNPEHSVPTCFTKDNKPALCVDESVCNKVGKGMNQESFEKCPKSGQVCCPIHDDGAEYRDAFVVPNSLAWDWTQPWPNLPWAPIPMKPPTPKPVLPVIQPLPQPQPTAPVISVNVTTNSTTGVAPGSGIVNLDTNCGVRHNVNLKEENELGFIVGGDIAKANSWPWTVAMNSSGRFVCGASIIDSRHILCAAHCVSHNKAITKPDQIKLLVGAHNRLKSGEYYGVEKVIVHSGYNERVMQNDIAIFKLDRNIAFSKTVNKICLPSNCAYCDDNSKQMAYLAGWGTTSAGGRVSDELREVGVPVIPLKDCQRAYDASMVTSKQICAGIMGVGGKDSCQGDSGGPMAMRPKAKENLYFQCGIVSWGKGCADAKYPGVYTKVCEFMDWIRDKTKN